MRTMTITLTEDEYILVSEGLAAGYQVTAALPIPSDPTAAAETKASVAAAEAGFLALLNKFSNTTWNDDS
jgi:hypothetical protein